MDAVQKALLVLIRQALWGKQDILEQVDWNKIEILAKEQGVLAFLYRGAMPYKDMIPVEILRVWRGAMYSAVLQNDILNQAQKEIIEQLQKEEVKPVVLKGVSIARYYTPIDIRSLGDIDLLVNPSDVDKASLVMMTNGYRRSEHEHAFHTSFSRGEVTVEIHQAASIVPEGRGGNKASGIMRCFHEEAIQIHVNDTVIYVLTDLHQALMLLMHMERHIIDEGIGLRQLCDWAVFLAAQDKQMIQEQVLPMCIACGLLVFAKVVSKACCTYLGLPSDKAEWCQDVDETLVQDFMTDVFRSGNLGNADNDGMSDLFIRRSIVEDRKQTALKSILLNLNGLAYKHFPITNTYKVLLPFFWLYLPLRYLVRSALGLRKRKNLLVMMRKSSKRYKLHRDLHLYEVE